jgi:hypothetical protein
VRTSDAAMQPTALHSRVPLPLSPLLAVFRNPATRESTPTDTSVTSQMADDDCFVFGDPDPAPALSRGGSRPRDGKSACVDDGDDSDSDRPLCEADVVFGDPSMSHSSWKVERQLRGERWALRRPPPPHIFLYSFRVCVGTRVVVRGVHAGYLLFVARLVVVPSTWPQVPSSSLALLDPS